MIKWVIINKHSENPNDWGFAQNSEFARVITGHTVRTLTTTATTLWPPVEEFAAVVLRRGLCEDLEDLEVAELTKICEWLSPLKDEDCRIFVHFGGQPTSTMTAQVIDNRWQTEMKFWHFLKGAKCIIRPYSITSGGGVNTHAIRQAQAKLKAIANGEDAPDDIRAFLHLVETAWNDYQQQDKATTGSKILVRCLDAYVAFQQVLAASQLPASAVLDSAREHLATVAEQRRKDAVLLAKSLAVELSDGGEWLTLLNTVANASADDQSLNAFCEKVGEDLRQQTALKEKIHGKDGTRPGGR